MVVPPTPFAPVEPPKKKVDLASQFLADLTSVTKAIPEPEQQQTPAAAADASSEEDGDGGWADFAGPADPTPAATPTTQPAISA